MSVGTEADAPGVGAVFGSGALLVDDCADAIDANVMMIPASTARRFAFHRNDNLLSRNALLTGFKLEVLGATLVAFPERRSIPVILHAIRCANFTATRPKLILAA